MRREISQAAAVSGAMVAVAAILHLHQRKKRLSKRRSAHISTEHALMRIPASQTAGTDAVGAPEVCLAQVERHSQLLAPEESIKLDGRAVICLEIEAAAEECVPTPLTHRSTDILRVVDIAVAAAILFLSVATGSLAPDAHFTLLLSAMVMAAFAAAAVRHVATAPWSQAPQWTYQVCVQGSYSGHTRGWGVITTEQDFRLCSAFFAAQTMGACTLSRSHVYINSAQRGLVPAQDSVSLTTAANITTRKLLCSLNGFEMNGFEITLHVGVCQAFCINCCALG